MKKTKDNFEEIYQGVLLNRHMMFRTHNKQENKFVFIFHSIIYFFTLMFKIIASIFFHKYERNEFNSIVGLNFSVYKHRFTDLSPDLLVIDYLYKKLTLPQFRLFRYVRIWEILRILFSPVPKKKRKSYRYEADNIFYKMVCLIEYSLLKNLIKEHKFKEVVTAGLNDRYCIFLSNICKRYDITLSVIQHGALTKFEGCYLIEAKRFYYMYEFSFAFLKYFFKNAHSIEFIPCKRNLKVQDLVESANECNVSFACTPSNINLNFCIIESILADLDSSVKVFVHPHPREKLEIYQKKLSVYSNVTVTKTKVKNIEFLVTRISSLGIELKSIGIEPVFINIEGHETDYLATGNYKTFDSIALFREWLINKSSISHMYRNKSC